MLQSTENCSNKSSQSNKSEVQPLPSKQLIETWIQRNESIQELDKKNKLREVRAENVNLTNDKPHQSFYPKNHVNSNPLNEDKAFKPFQAPPIHLSKEAMSARHVVSRDLPVFSGNPREWPRFITAFESTTELCEMQDAENASRLQKCLKGKAYDAVQNILYLPGGVSGAISTLRGLFGRPEFIISELLEDLRKVQNRSQMISSYLSVMHYTLKTCVQP